MKQRINLYLSDLRPVKDPLSLNNIALSWAIVLVICIGYMGILMYVNKDLTQELKTLGAHNMTSHRPSKVTGKSRIRKFLSAYEGFRQNDGLLPASYQVLWGVVGKN